jgi:hypothetical protein
MPSGVPSIINLCLGRDTQASEPVRIGYLRAARQRD